MLTPVHVVVIVLLFCLCSLVVTVHAEVTTTNNKKQNTIAVFIQAYGVNHTVHNVIWDDIESCVSNIAKAQKMIQDYDEIPWENVKRPFPFVFDIYLSVHPKVAQEAANSLQKMGALNVYVKEVVENVGLDIKQFIDQLEMSSRAPRVYDYFLKIHSKGSIGWRQLALESLCGTPSQVLTILNAFNDENKNIGVVVPQGLLVSKSSGVDKLFRPLRKYYKSLDVGINQSFTPKNVENMKRIYKSIFQRDLNPQEDKYLCAAGTMFWAKFSSFRVNNWVQAIQTLKNKWTRGYVEDEGIEHAIERLFVTIPYFDKSDIAEVVPAVKPMAIYFPQYHQMKENDYIHGEGFTEWTLLRPSTVDILAKPLDVNEGGFGYYDLTSLEIRKRQGELARQAGVHGFVYYHYWFSGNSSLKYKNPVMGKIPELMLRDGEPDMPFMFSWANEPWTSTWSGGDGRVYLPQNYGTEKSWKKHFQYLLRFFKHPNYIHVDRKPVFAIYRIGLLKKEGVLKRMLSLWRTWAVEAGLNGIYIVYTLNNFIFRDKVLQSKVHRYCDAAFQFFPTIAAAFPTVKNASSTTNIDTGLDHKPQYWGGFTSFSNRVRRFDNDSWTRLVSPQEFKDSIQYTFTRMGEDLPLTFTQINNPNLFFVTAWNEWNEQAQLEPSDKFKFAYLSGLKSNLESFPLTIHSLD